MYTQTEMILNRICVSAAEKKVSEIYLINAQIPFINLDGKIQPLSGENILAASFISDVISAVLDNKEQTELQEKKQIITVKEIGKLGSVQIHVYYQKNTPAICLKLLSQEALDMEKIELPKMVQDFTNLSKGIVFVAGPHDSGRFSLVTSLIDNINKNQNKYIATLEKPIKYNLVGIKSIIEQREIGRDVLSFKEGLNFIRERGHVDVVMISQIKNAEIMEELFALAEAGTLIFAIMDTGSSVQTIKRILHFFPTSEEENIRYFLSENLAGIIATRLVPKVGGGRIRALEVLSAPPSVKTIIAEGKLHQLSTFLQTGEDTKSVSMDRYLADLVTSDKISLEDAIKNCVDEEMLKSLLRR